MKTYEQLMKHYWGTIVPMAEAEGVNPWECVKLEGRVMICHPKFEYKPKFYTFAITVLEGKPVFEGDTVYSKVTGEKMDWRCFHPNANNYFGYLTWTPPTKKRTFMLNGEEYISPVHDLNGCRLDFLGVDYYFETVIDRNKVASAINNILAKARNKE